MRDFLIFLCGLLAGVLSISTLVGISYSAAVTLGRGLGMVEGMALFAKVFAKNRASKKAEPVQPPNSTKVESVTLCTQCKNKLCSYKDIGLESTCCQFIA